MSSSFRNRIARYGAIAIALWTIAVYSNSLRLGFAGDMSPILGDERVRGLSFANLRNIFAHTYFWPNGEGGIYRPLTTLSWLFNYAILGNEESAAGYHAVNLALHLVNVFLVFAVARRLSKDPRIPTAIAGLWAIHPLLTEAVANLAGRADLLAAAAVLGGFLLYLEIRESAGGGGVGSLAVLGLIAGAGACSKETAVILPAIFALYEACQGRDRNVRALVRAVIASLVPIALVLCVRAAVIAASLPAEFPFVDNPLVDAGPLQIRLTALGVLARYLLLLVWPAQLSADYSYSQISVAAGSAADWLLAAIVPICLACAAAAVRRRPMATFLAGAAFLAILPASNLIILSGTIMGERLMYLPSIALVALAVIGLVRLADRMPHMAVLAAAVIAIACGARTWVRNKDWRDDFTIAAAGAQTSPASFKMHRALADFLLKNDASSPNAALLVDEAEKSVRVLETLRDELSVPDPWNVAAKAHLTHGDICALGGCAASRFDARPDYERAVELAQRSRQIASAVRARRNRLLGRDYQPANSEAEALRTMAAANLRLARFGPALEAAMRAREIAPKVPAAYVNLAYAQLGLGRGEEGAITLAEGMFITGDRGLGEKLTSLLEAGVDKQRCAVRAGPMGRDLNPSCPIVRDTYCAAARKVGRADILQQFRCDSRN